MNKVKELFDMFLKRTGQTQTEAASDVCSVYSVFSYVCLCAYNVGNCESLVMCL